jgi:prepilin-type N-terminal cleavage/methylation domain-containing protein
VFPAADRRGRRLRRLTEDRGFTLIEVMVAMTVLALGAMAAVPLLISGAAAANHAKLNTQAKNLAQQRLERMRDLPFHVERQNGPYVDLLDQYYTNRSSAVATRTFGAETSTGQWVGSGTPAAGEPAVPFYRVAVASMPGYPMFSQTIDTQFLRPNGSAVPSTQFAAYDSQTEANDGPPTMLLGVTVLTKWTVKGKEHVFRLYTRIADSRGALSLLTSQGKAEFMRVKSTDASGNALSSDVASSVSNGNLSSGSVASIDVRAGFATDGVNPDVSAARWLATSPSGVSTGNATASTVKAGSGTCGWTAFGTSSVSNATSAITGGVPLVPSNVGIASPPANEALTGLMANGSNSCGLFSFNNGTTAYALPVAPSGELVRMPDPGGNARSVTGSSWVRASDTSTNPHTVESGAAASSSQAVQILPGLSFVADGQGLVNVTLSSSRLTCSASVVPGSTQSQTSTGSYTVTISYWSATNNTGGGQRVTASYSWSSLSGPSADPLTQTAMLPSNIVVYQNGATTLRLSDFISSWSLLRSVTEGATNGVHALDGIFSLATVPTRLVGSLTDPASSVGVQVGKLSCVADDNR